MSTESFIIATLQLLLLLLLCVYLLLPNLVFEDDWCSCSCWVIGWVVLSVSYKGTLHPTDSVAEILLNAFVNSECFEDPSPIHRQSTCIDTSAWDKSAVSKSMSPSLLLYLPASLLEPNSTCAPQTFPFLKATDPNQCSVHTLLTRDIGDPKPLAVLGTQNPDLLMLSATKGTQYNALYRTALRLWWRNVRALRLQSATWTMLPF